MTYNVSHQVAYPSNNSNSNFGELRIDHKLLTAISEELLNCASYPGFQVFEQFGLI